jgi:plasmid stabilization system protein ParE
VTSEAFGCHEIRGLIRSNTNERNPTAAAQLDADRARCIERLAAREFEGPVSRLRSGAVVHSLGRAAVSHYYQRHADELLIVRVYHRRRSKMGRAARFAFIQALLSRVNLLDVSNRVLLGSR